MIIELPKDAQLLLHDYEINLTTLTSRLFENLSNCGINYYENVLKFVGDTPREELTDEQLIEIARMWWGPDSRVALRTMESIDELNDRTLQSFAGLLDELEMLRVEAAYYRHGFPVRDRITEKIRRLLAAYTNQEDQSARQVLRSALREIQVELRKHIRERSAALT